MTDASKRLFDLDRGPDRDPNDVEGNTRDTQRKARRDAATLKKRALQSIAENPDE